MPLLRVRLAQRSIIEEDDFSEATFELNRFCQIEPLLKFGRILDDPATLPALTHQGKVFGLSRFQISDRQSHESFRGF